MRFVPANVAAERRVELSEAAIEKSPAQLHAFNLKRVICLVDRHRFHECRRSGGATMSGASR
jgi:hypothetical protein